MIELSARTFGETPQQMRSMIEGAKHAVEDISGALPAIVARFHVQMARRFRDEGEGGPSGKWAALSDNPPGHGYRSWKARKHPGKGILELTGSLKHSLTAQGEGSIVQYGLNSVFIGSGVEYAQYHQDGTDRMPARLPIDPNDRDAAEWAVEVRRYYEKATSKLGWKGRFAGAMAGV